MQPISGLHEVKRLYDTLPRAQTLINLLAVRHSWGTEQTPHQRKNMANRHRIPRLAGYRRDMVLKIKLPDFDALRRHQVGAVSPAEIKDDCRRNGTLLPSRSGPQEKPMYFSSIGHVIDQYIPFESASQYSSPSKFAAMKNKASSAENKVKNVRETRKIRRYDEDFSSVRFPPIAQDVYIKAHEALAEGRIDDLHQFATDLAYAEMRFNTDRKTLYWRFLRSLEPARVVQVRTSPIMNEQNLFGQITVRFHTQQIFAVYDRFGRLMHGSPTVAKDVLEYVVFEKHLPNIYGLWRIHCKIVPSWLRRSPSATTFVHEEKGSEQNDTAENG